jgi:hypothetical protein
MEQTNEKRVWTNAEIAQVLDRMGELLEGQRANPYRVNAYRAAAVSLRESGQSAQNILLKFGVDGLKREFPGVGESLARTIAQLIMTNRIGLLAQLEGEVAAEQILSTVPGIGPRLAERIHEELGISTLRELQDATLDGRLDRVEGFGPGRLRGVRESLRGRLTTNRPVRKTPARPTADEPSAQVLLEIDAEYRARAAQDALPKIAPRRYNPTGEAWLPILHTQKGAAQFTAVYSNTARAHELNTIRDWVVIYRDDQAGSGQWTVVTGRYGALAGKRMVRGRERECEAFYAAPKTGHDSLDISQSTPAAETATEQAIA